ncbi:MAG: enhanced intracellular survival protein Eis, partial [Spirochaetales bacterium]
PFPLPSSSATLSGMEIREITRDEVADYIGLAQYAFGKYSGDPPDPKTVEAFPLEGSLAAFVDGEVASRVRVRPFTQSVRGTVKRMGGISGVATAPEFRGRGLVRSLMIESLRWMREHGRPVTMLRPFREQFYERFGYVRTACSLAYSISTDSFAEYLHRPPKSDLTFERVPAASAQTRYAEWMKALAAHAHGHVLSEELTAAQWVHAFKDRLYVFVARDGAPAALASYTKEGFLQEGRLTVNDFVWSDFDSLDALKHYFALHRDQTSTIHVTLPAGANLASIFPRMVGAKSAQLHGSPWMVRIVDVEQALDGIGVSEDGLCRVAVRDEQCPWNEGVYEIASRGGRLSAKRTDAAPDVELSIAALSALLYGSFRMSQVAREFEPAVRNPDALALLGRWLPEQPVFNDYWF